MLWSISSSRCPAQLVSGALRSKRTTFVSSFGGTALNKRMASKGREGHLERTAGEPRDAVKSPLCCFIFLLYDSFRRAIVILWKDGI